MIYLDKDDIAFINQRTVGTLCRPTISCMKRTWIIWLKLYKPTRPLLRMFGEPLYPSLTDKAVVYCYSIIGNHIFSDGNKRTGLKVALAFLTLNGHRLSRELPHTDLYEYILKVASGQSSLDECRALFLKHVILNG